MPILFLQELPIYTLLLLLVPPLYYLYTRASCTSAELPTNWPILHMFPSLVANRHNMHDYCTRVLAGSGRNFRAHGPPGTGMRFFLTCDPANVRHIFTTNYANFPKGEEFAAIFDIMSGGIFTIDGEPARRQRAKIKGVLSSPQFLDNTASYCLHKTEKNLLPFFTEMASVGTPFNVQEIMSRFMFDLAATSLFGVDPGLLSSDMPPMDAARALDTVMEVGFFRHIMPTSCWKLMRRLNIGPERKLSTAHGVLRRFVVEMLDRSKSNKCHIGNEHLHADIMSPFHNDPDYTNDELSRALIISYLVAARDTVATTLTWIFYKLGQNPNIVSNIRNELSPIASRKLASSAGGIVIFEPTETKSLVYLRAVLYETLRLYPPAAIERKTVATNDIMPSGHKVHSGDTIFICIQSMGRMEGMWGKDCLDYKPDRWLSEDGNKLRYVPSHKFLAFNSGPRLCLGKEIAVMQMKTVIAATVWNFDVQVLEGQSIEPKSSCILEMKNGLKIKLKKRAM
ncbi:alkane hydroxylase MAH1-like isoform X1 [Hordeum vulgare subsp. vulgare]|uniref:alkane hydroxylase MAH1-like isoform X1 n=1 Tax=Hordeum vulgare subsp. vulgare TaxID=112509 RepID=UPI000296E14B|nr:alkane hydroxylase MAH1-like isoform X1 [Hordeum vulgare subsp. vulgare]